MQKTMWVYTLAWVAAVAAAFTLAFAAPTESAVMGKLPQVTAKRLDQRSVALPEGFEAERTLALIGFSRKHRPDIESWIDGLRLYNDASIAWVRMPVLSDPGSDHERDALEQHLQTRYSGERERERVMAVVTQRRDAFLRAAGLGDPEQMVAVVVNRSGEVLARAVGRFDADKAEALRETLLASAL